MRKTLILVAIAVLLLAALVPLGGLGAALVLIAFVAPSLLALFGASGWDLVPRPAPLRISSPDRAPPRARA